MSGDPEGPTPLPQSELSPERCPNCGRPLKFPENRPEGLCAACGIYVEILKPLASPGAPPLDRTRVQTSLKRDLVRMCEERGLDPSGNKADLVRRLLEYIERNPPAPQAIDEDLEAPRAAPEPPPLIEDVAKRREVALFHLNLEQALEEPEEPSPPVARKETARPQDELASTPARVPVAVPPPPAEPVAAPPDPPAPEGATPLSEEAEATLPPEFDELFADDEPVALEAFPEPPEPPPDETPVGPSEPLTPKAAPVEPAPEAEAAEARTRRDRAIFYVGVLCALFGGVGLLLGSFIHDLLRVPMFGEAYEVFGPLNATAAAMGGAFLLAGLCAIAFAFRGGILRARPAPGV